MLIVNVQQLITRQNFWNLILESSTCFLVLLIVTWWFIWKARCRFIFQDEVFSPRVVAMATSSLVKDIHCAYHVTNLPTSQSRFISWSLLLLTSWLLMWMGVRADPKKMGFAGMVRDHFSNWIYGFAGHVHGEEVILGELMGIFRGLLETWNLGFRKVNLFFWFLVFHDFHLHDSQPMLWFATSRSHQSIQDMISRDLIVTIVHT